MSGLKKEKSVFVPAFEWKKKKIAMRSESGQKDGEREVETNKTRIEVVEKKMAKVTKRDRDGEHYRGQSGKI